MEYKYPDLEHDSGRKTGGWKYLQGKGLRVLPSGFETADRKIAVSVCFLDFFYPLSLHCKRLWFKHL
jgi:hypothetical protein